MKTQGMLTKFYHYAFPMQTALVTCMDENDTVNIITIAWHTPISKKPPLYGISLAPQRYSHQLITKGKEFVINFVPYDLAEKAQFCGTHTGRKTNKAEATHLTFLPSQTLKAPIIKECYAHLECTLYDAITLGDHTLFVGEVVAAHYDNAVFKNDLLQLETMQPLYYIGDNTYTTLNEKKVQTF